MVDLLLGNVLPYIIGAIAIFGGLWGYGKKREKDGRNKVVDEITEADKTSAGVIKEKLDEASVDGDALERLRKSGRLRD